MLKKGFVSKTLFEVVLLIAVTALFLIIFGSFIFDPFVMIVMYLFYIAFRCMVQKHITFNLLGFLDYANS